MLKDQLKNRLLASGLITFVIWGPAPLQAAEAKCTIGKLIELPVTTANLVPLVTGKINGESVQFIADTGAFWSVMSTASASRLNLALKPVPFGFYLTGVGGAVDVSLAVVKRFEADRLSLSNVDFLVGGSDVRSESVGVLGQNFFRVGDVEFDLAGGVLRLIRPDGGCKKAALAYWRTPDQAFQVIELERTTPAKPFTVSTALLNGKAIKVLFDTGSPTSSLSLSAAERAGVKPDSAGVVDGGEASGIGRKRSKSYIGTFDSFALGGEEIRHTRLRFMDLGDIRFDMLVGADFFLSHHVYIASSQHLMYFTYNGGPVFNLAARRPQTADPVTAAGDAPEKPAVQPEADSEDASGHARRGVALASRKEFDQALIELNTACELDPNASDYFYQRAVVHFELKQSGLAVNDLDRAIELRADNILALMMRARYRAQQGKRVDAVADLEVVDRTVPKQDDVRFALGNAYQHSGEFNAAASNYTTWLSFHDVDSRVPLALRARCEIRALQGAELPQALADCDKALGRLGKSSEHSAQTLTDRGLVRLRMGDYAKSIKDFDAALALQPTLAWALYGRGLAKIHLAQPTAGDADVAKAASLMPSVVDTFTHYGMTR